MRKRLREIPKAASQEVGKALGSWLLEELDIYRRPQAHAIVKAFVELGADLRVTTFDDITDVEGLTVLMMAVRSNNVRLVKFIANSDRILIDKTDQLGRTALMYAANWGKINSVIALLEIGARKDMVDVAGNTALTYAKRQVEISVIDDPDPDRSRNCTEIVALLSGTR